MRYFSDLDGTFTGKVLTHVACCVVSLAFSVGTYYIHRVLDGRDDPGIYRVEIGLPNDRGERTVTINHFDGEESTDILPADEGYLYGIGVTG